MNIDEKLKMLYKISVKEAEEKKESTLNEINKEFETQCSNYKKRAEEKSEKKLKNEKFNIEQEVNKKITEVSIDTKKRLIEFRKELTKNIFENVLNKLNDYTNTEEYKEYLVNTIENAVNEFGSEIDVYVVENDKKYIDYIFDKTKIKPKISEEDFIGGTKISIKNKNIIVNNTLKLKFDDEKNSFNELKISIE